MRIDTDPGRLTQQPDVDQAQLFLDALDPLPDPRFGFATFDDRGDDPRLAMRLYGDLGWAEQLTGRNKGRLRRTVSMLAYMQSLGASVFVTVQRLNGRGATGAQVNGIRAIISDADDDRQLDNRQRFIDATGLTPTITVASGGRTASGADKLQCYWLVDGCAVSAFPELQALLLSRTGTDPAVKDVARVLRLPGFLHMKREPRMTRMIERTGIVYPIDEIERRLRQAPIVQTVAARASGRGGVGQSGNAVERTARLRELLHQHGGLITPSMRQLIREATPRTEHAPGNRHATLVAIAARLAQCGWRNQDIHGLVLPAVEETWGVDRAERLDSILRWVRGREAETVAAQPSPTERMTRLAAAFGAGRRGDAP